MGIEECAVTPGTEEFAVSIKNRYRRVFTLERVNPVLGIGGHGADHGEGLTLGQFGPILHFLISVFSGAHSSHGYLPPPNPNYLRGNLYTADYIQYCFIPCLVYLAGLALV